MTATTLPGVLLPAAIHASRPSASAVAGGTLFPCTTHSLIYQSDGVSTWTTWATLGTAGAYVAGGTDVAVADGGTGSSTAAGAATNLGLGTGDSPQHLAVNIGHASDTTVDRLSAGDIEVEGNRIFRVGGADVPIADGGTGASTKAAGFDALSPMTTSGDVIYGGASGTGTRLAKGTNGDVLTLASGLPSWAAPGGGGSGTVTTVKDEGSNLSTAVTSIDFVGAGVTATGTTAVTVTIPGGSAQAHNELDAAVLVNATSTGDAGSRADHFAGTSLDAAWANEANALTSGPTVKYSSVWMFKSASGGHHRARAYTPSGAFRVEAKIKGWLSTASGGAGLFIKDSGTTDSAGDEMLIHFNGSSNVVEAYSVDSGSSTQRGSSSVEAVTFLYYHGCYVAIERNGSNAWTLQYSQDRAGWQTLVSGHSKTFTVAKVGFRLYGPATMSVDFFDVVS